MAGAQSYYSLASAKRLRDIQLAAATRFSPSRGSQSPFYVRLLSRVDITAVANSLQCEGLGRSRDRGLFRRRSDRRTQISTPIMSLPRYVLPHGSKSPLRRRSRSRRSRSLRLRLPESAPAGDGVLVYRTIPCEIPSMDVVRSSEGK